MGETTVQILGGAAGGSAILFWFAKFMAARLIKQYDEKLKEHDKELKEVSKKLAVMDHITDGIQSDLNAAHCKIRQLEKESSYEPGQSEESCELRSKPRRSDSSGE